MSIKLRSCFIKYPLFLQNKYYLIFNKTIFSLLWLLCKFLKTTYIAIDNDIGLSDFKSRYNYLWIQRSAYPYAHGVACYIMVWRCPGYTYTSFLFVPAVPPWAQLFSNRAHGWNLESVLPSSWDLVRWRECTLWPNHHMTPNRKLRNFPLGGYAWGYALWNAPKL